MVRILDERELTKLRYSNLNDKKKERDFFCKWLGDRPFGADDVHFPDVFLFTILKSIFSTVFGQYGEAQKFRLLPAGQNPDHRVPRPAPLETQGPVMQTVSGIGLNRIVQKETPGR
jgi:hypothetical protein